MADHSSYDVIVIGSGIGSLTVASLLAQLRGQRVLVVERHFKSGGYTHSFQRPPYHWDVGLHYVGQMAEDASTRWLFDLVTGGAVTWSRMPDPFEVFDFPAFRFALRADRERYIADLMDLFPHQRQGIGRYMRSLRRASLGFAGHTLARTGSRTLGALGRISQVVFPPRWEQTTKARLDALFDDVTLKAVLTAQWGDYGLPPASSPFLLHALIVNHYLEGGYYPQGGAATIAAAAKPCIEAAGGQLLLGHQVTEIVVEGGKAVGVMVQGRRPITAPQEFRAPVIVSGAGAATTYLQLLPHAVDLPFRATLHRFVETHPPATTLGVYLGFKADPRTLGFRGENHWLFGGFDHDAIHACRGAWAEGGEPGMAFLSFPSLKDLAATVHTGEIITFSDHRLFAPWQNQPCKKRDADYQALKDRLGAALIRMVDGYYPGFTDLVDYAEVSTPLTNEAYTAHAGGAVYGLSSVPARFLRENLPWSHPRSPIAGLYLTGADVCAMGIAGALFGGALTLTHLPGGLSPTQIYRAAKARA